MEELKQEGGLEDKSLIAFQERVRKLSYELIHLKGHLKKAKSGDASSDDAPNSSSKQIGPKVRIKVYFYQGQRYELLMVTPVSVYQFATSRKASLRLNSLLKAYSKKSEEKNSKF
jgi:hypothetical protein